MFLYYAGLRLDEARNISWSDVDVDRETIHLRTAKGDKEVYKCEKCGHIWMKGGDETPLICPKCKTARWNKPQKKKK